MQPPSPGNGHQQDASSAPRPGPTPLSASKPLVDTSTDHHAAESQWALASLGEGRQRAQPGAPPQQRRSPKNFSETLLPGYHTTEVLRDNRVRHPIPESPSAATSRGHAAHSSSQAGAPQPGRSTGSVKRSPAYAPRDRVLGSSSVKKPRTAAPNSIKMGNLNAARSLAGESPASPLFFSHHSLSRNISRPHSFSTSDAVASMLSGSGEGAVTKTLKLPRATIKAHSPARSGSTPGSWTSSMEISAPTLSSDTKSSTPGLQMLQGIGIIELLEQDQRPTFMIDLGITANLARPMLHILYYNTALRSCPEILQLLKSPHNDTASATELGQFHLWAMSTIKSSAGEEIPLLPHTYGGITWTGITIRHRFRFVSGNANFTRVENETPPLNSSHPTEHNVKGSPMLEASRPATPLAEHVEPLDYFGNASRKSSRDNAMAEVTEYQMKETDFLARKHPDDFANQVLQAQPTRSVFDWTRLELTDDLPEHIKFAKSLDWASTPLGPMDEWSSDLRMFANIIMGSPHPSAMYWGTEFVSIYNAAYVELAGQKHPQLMGQTYSEGWAEIWSDIEPVFKCAIESGQATMKHDNRLFMNRNGFLEETFFSWSVVPIVGSEGDVVGLYNPAFENTRRRINERRMLTLREVGERTAAASSVADFWPQIQKGLEYNAWDVPFALIYSVKDDAESEVSSLHSGSYAYASHLLLEGSIGVPSDHPLAAQNVDIRTSMDGFAPYMRQSVVAGGSVMLLSKSDGTLPLDVVEGLDWQGFGDSSTTLVVLPIVPTTTGDSVTGFIILGLNPRRPYDDDYQLFIHLLSRQLATSLASAVLFEEEVRRGQQAAQLAALDRQELSMQLLLTTQQANESEYRFTRMAEFAPVGMFIADSVGQITWCNDMWWQISRHSRSEHSIDRWMDSVRSEDRGVLESAWHNLVNDKETISIEFRFKCSQRRSGGNEIDTWVLMSAFPEQNSEGHLKSIFGCITDISSQKWAEKVQNERRVEAVEHKRQQENFIDITSHEMRNPLSAILQCADQIASNISGFVEYPDKPQVDELLENCLDAANTINLCASHQKRIVDDILTLSKADSNLLTVTPVDEQPTRVVQRALKIFESELIAHDIGFEFRVDESLERYGIRWLKLDPSRLRQVLINLMTNAIKFTQGREDRSIVVTLSASKDVSEIISRQGVEYLPRDDMDHLAVMNLDNDADWGNGELVNLHCSVEDTGPGLGHEELKLLFQRFRQATPRTHVQYGGSGLGLFISRILAEMQGGQIGVSSSKGKGSKFSFYIQSRYCLQPPSDVESEPISSYKIPRKSQSPVHTSIAKAHPPAERRKSTLTEKSDDRGLFDVLIVEDNLVNQKVLQRQLRNAGNNTFVANHGQEALQTLEKSRFWAGKEAEGVDISVILMDLEMPVMDGMTCARRIRELEKEGTIVEHIPIIAVTAYARPEQIANAKAAGIDDVISKPFRIPELIPRIEEVVAKYKTLSL